MNRAGWQLAVMRVRLAKSPAAWLAVAMAAAVPQTRADDGAWNTNAAGTWSTAGNWNSTVVPGTTAGDTVDLTFDISAARTVTIDTTSRTVGDLNIGDPASSYFAYTLAASGGASLIVSSAAPDSKAILRYPGGSASQASMSYAGSITLQNRDLWIENASDVNPTTRLYNPNVSSAGTTTLTIGGGDQSGNFAGDITDELVTHLMAITKIGTGTQTFSGVNSTYTGGTLVSGGVLAVARVADAAGSIGTGSLNITGNFAADGTIKVRLLGGFNPEENAVFDLADWTGTFSGAPTFDFNEAALAPGLSWDTTRFASDGTLRVIPEPSVTLLALGAGLGMLGRRRRASNAPDFPAPTGRKMIAQNNALGTGSHHLFKP